MKKRMTTLAVAMLVAGGLAVAQPQRGGRMAAGRPGPGPAAMALDPDALKQTLGLSDAQVEQLRGLRREQAQAARPQLEQMKEKQRALAEAMKADNPDPAVVGRLMVELKQARTAARPERAALREKALAVLTPDQKAKLAELEKALTLMPAARQAAALGLIAMPEGIGEGAGRARMRQPRMERQMRRAR